MVQFFLTHSVYIYIYISYIHKCIRDVCVCSRYKYAYNLWCYVFVCLYIIGCAVFSDFSLIMLVASAVSIAQFVDFFCGVNCTYD